MLRDHAFVSLLALVIAGCSAAATPSSSTPPTSETTDGGVQAPEGDASSGEPPPSNDAGADTGETSGPATLPIASATYEVTQAGATTLAFDVAIALENDTTDGVTSIDEMTFDFGGGNKVALNQSACQGSFPIAAGATTTIQVRMIVSASGEVSPAGFSMHCPTSQSFGAGDGTAPSDGTFSAPIALHVAGAMEKGTFAASGLASRGN